MTTRRREWHVWACFALGLWLALSPWAVGYAGSDAATANAVFLGLALALGGHFQAALGAASGEWLQFAAGIWLLAAPFVLGFGEQAVATAATLSAGALVAALAGSALVPVSRDAH